MQLRVAGAQLQVTTDVRTNVEAICRAIAWSEAQGADILLTPEGSLSGYTPTFDASEVNEGLAEVTEVARRAHLGLALATCFVEPDDGACYNQIRFYEPDGSHLGFHSKILRCGSLEQPPRGEINQFAMCPLRTFGFRGITIGGLICNDMWANPECTPQPDPHLSQQLATMGARIAFHAVNGGRDGSAWSDVAWRYHEANLRMRARAGRLWVVTVDSCYPLNMKCSAPSGVVAPDGTWACQAEPWGEQYFVHEIELDG
jgi:predicted amidohydrolase